MPTGGGKSWGSPFSRRGTKRYLLAALGVALAAFLYLSYRDFTRVETGENVPAVKWLPPAARNVSFYRSYLSTSCEFDIPEQDFLAWAKREGWPIQQVEHGENHQPPYAISRYHRDRHDVAYPPDPQAHATESQVRRYLSDLSARQSMEQKEIGRGYYYAHEQDNGGGVWVGYDADEGRAYFHSSPR